MNKDNKQIQQIIKESLEAVGLDQPGTAYYDPQLGYLYEYYDNLLKANYWVAVDNHSNEVIGGIGIGPFGHFEEVAELQKYYLKEGYQNLGVGSQLFKQALSFAKEQKYTSLYLETMDVLSKANKVYEHYGFKKLQRPLDGSEHGLMNRWYILEL